MMHRTAKKCSTGNASDGAKSAPDEVRFLHNWIRDPLRTAAVSPSGKALAKMMAGYVDPSHDGPVIELGPGTGPVTQALLARGLAPERLVLIEYNPEFCNMLKARYPGVRVIRGDAYDMEKTLDGVLDKPAIATVSSLPLFTQPVPARHGLLDQSFRLSQPSAPFIQFTYAVVSPVPLAPERMSAHVSPRVWKNLPPARVWVYRSAKGGASPDVAAA